MSGRAGLLGWYVPTGRIRRSDWWVRYVLLIGLLGLMASVIDAQWFPDSHPRFEEREGSADLADVLWFFPDQGGPVTAVVGLVLTVPNVAATVTRLHDRDHSAWWLLWGLVPVVGWLVLLITCGFLGTEPHANRFGPPPR